MKSGLKYTQSFGKCNEQDMTFRIPCAQRAAIPVQDGSTVRSALTCEQPARTERYSAVSSSTWPCSLRYRAAYRSRCCVGSCTFTSGCFAKQQTKWYRGERPVQMHRLAFVFEEDEIHLCVSVFHEDGGFFHPSGPFRLPCFWAQPSCFGHCRCERKERGIKK